MATPAPDLSVSDQIAPDGSLSSIKQAPVPPSGQNFQRQQPEGDEPPQPKGEVDKGQPIDPNAPPPETDPNDVSIDDFESVKVNKIPEKKEVKPKVDDEEVDLAPRDNKDVKPPTDTKPKDKQNLPDNRDYSTIPEPLRPHFKRMGNDAFATLAPLFTKYTEEIKQKDDTIKKLQEGKDIIPESYYEHERAYMLTPEFERAAMQVQEASAVAQHWEEQLNAVRTGAKEFRLLTKDANGRIVYGETVPADVNSETQLMKYFHASQNQLMQYQGKLQGVQEGYKTQHAQAKSWVDGVNKQWFAPPFEDSTTPLAVMATEFVGKLPAMFRNNPLAVPFARAMVTSQMLVKLLGEEKAKGGNGKGTNGAPVRPKTSRQPNEGDLGGDGDGASPKDKAEDVGFDDFKKRMNGALIR